MSNRRNGEFFLPNQVSDTNTVDALNDAVNTLADVCGGKYEPEYLYGSNFRVGEGGVEVGGGGDYSQSPSSDVKIKETYQTDYYKNGQRKFLHRVQRISEQEFYIACKWKDNPNKDILIQFGKLNPNDLTAFLYVSLIDNTEDTPVQNPSEYVYNSQNWIAANGFLLSNGAASDQIGPYQLAEGSWAGGSHSKDVGGTLYNTAKNNKTILLCDDVEVAIGDAIDAYDITVLVDNDIFRPDQLPTETTVIEEFVTYNVSNGTIEVYVDQAYKASITVLSYYGLQFNDVSYADNFVISNALNASPETYQAGITSGVYNTYPYVDMIAQISSGDGYAQIGWMDRKYGLGSSPLIDGGADDFAFTAGSKAYYRLMSSKTWSVANNSGWHGAFTWCEKGPSIGKGDGNYITPVYLKGETLLMASVDSGLTSQEIKMWKLHISKELVEKTDSNQNGIINWRKSVYYNTEVKCSSGSASSCVYNLVER